MDAIRTPEPFAELSHPTHWLHLYEAHDDLCRAVVEFVCEGLAAGESAVLIADAPHRDGVVAGLREAGLDIDALRATRRLVLLDAAATLATFMRDGVPDPELFAQHVESIIEEGTRAGVRVRAFGEMVDLLWRAQQQAAALQLESLWQEMQTRRPFSLLCAYGLASFAEGVDVRRVCEAHDHVHVPTTVSSPHEAALVFAKDIGRRLEVERALQSSRRELERKDSELEDQKLLLASCLENAAIGMHFVGPDGTILWANDTELALLGYDAEQYIGHNIAEFHVDDHIIRDILERLSCNETLRDQPARVRARDGSIRHVAIDSNVLFRDGRFLYTRCFTRDVTEQVRRAQIDGLLADATALLARALDPATAMDEVARLCLRELADVCLLDVEGGLHFAATDPRLHGCRDALAGWAAAADDPGSTVPRYPSVDGLGACLRVPLALRDVHLGGLALGRATQSGPFDEASRRCIAILADRIAAFLERARLHRETLEARERAEAANRAKDQFLAMLGHELRNPLAPILMALELLRIRLGDAGGKERDAIERHVRHLVRLVDDLLDVARVTKGKLELHRRPVEVSTIVDAAVEMAMPMLQAKDQRLMTDVPRTGLVVAGDAQRLAQVVHNLLTNAAKFSERCGRVEIVARRRDDWVTLEVRDFGRGIDAALLPQLWDPFVQGGHDERRADREGLGLGLAIVKALVELHGGTVAAHSDGAGRGARFTVELPVCASAFDDARVVVDSRAASIVERPTTLRALIVDDNEDAGMLLSEFLGELGFATAFASNGEDAIRVATGFAPDVALLDLAMPVMDGYTLAAELRRRAQTQATKLVALTGYGQDQDRRRTRAAGFDEHLVKPVDTARLRTVLARLLPCDPSNNEV